jgi:hypothetical protein
MTPSGCHGVVELPGKKKCHEMFILSAVSHPLPGIRSQNVESAFKVRFDRQSVGLQLSPQNNVLINGAGVVPEGRNNVPPRSNGGPGPMATTQSCFSHEVRPLTRKTAFVAMLLTWSE